MLPTTITINTVPFDKVYAQSGRSKFSDELTATIAPKTIDVAHQTDKTGVVSTALVYKDDVLVVGRESEGYKRIKTMLKIQYNPLDGRVDIAAVLSAQINALASLSVAELTSLLNKEV
jgi:hypothetical protein